jgi:purine-binding chemotaxis protein CheW
MAHPLPSLAPSTHHDVPLFGSFHLGELELALPLDTLQEVIDFPKVVTRSPLAPDHVAGLFMLHGAMIPILDLGRYLGLAGEGDRGESRLAIIASNHRMMGVRFDRTGDVLRVAPARVAPFRAENDPVGLIDGAFSMDDRIVHMLSADALARLPGVMQAGSSDLSAQARRQRRAETIRKVIAFHVEGRAMALPIDTIHEIIRLPALEPSVLSDEVCRGWLGLRGRPVPVLDIARFLGLDSGGAALPPASGVEDARRVVVLRQGDFHLGLLVDDVDTIVSYTDAQLLPMPAIDGQTGLFSSCIGRRDTAADDLLVMDTAALFADPYMAHLAKGHHDLYLVADDLTRRTEARRRRIRETWLTFRLERLMAFRIGEVREVIDSHEPLVRPPGAPPYVRGVLKVGQSLVTVIDLRRHYGMTPVPDDEHSKLIVVQHDDHRYGLVVDSVHSIVGIDPSEKIVIPMLIASHMDARLQKDLHRLAESPEHGSVVLLETETLLRRLTGNAGD